jgi:nitrite reductase/ring-hydroxylating ferredoxin subunit
MTESRKLLLCRLAELPEGSSRGFTVDVDSGRDDIFLVRKNGRLFGYRNSCPHTGSPLDWVPDQFLNIDGDLIQCATHHALFRIEDGACIAGPCAGRELSPVTLEIRNDEIFLMLE